MMLILLMYSSCVLVCVSLIQLSSSLMLPSSNCFPQDAKMTHDLWLWRAFTLLKGRYLPRTKRHLLRLAAVHVEEAPNLGCNCDFQALYFILFPYMSFYPLFDTRKLIQEAMRNPSPQHGPSRVATKPGQNGLCHIWVLRLQAAET